jgi:hypothetical protein
MKRTMFVLSVALILSAFACGSDGPAGPSTGSDSEFYPLAVGNTWTYDRSGSFSAAGVQVGTVSGKAVIEITGTATHSSGFDVFVQKSTINDTTVIYGQTIISDSTFTDYLRVTDSGFYGYPHLTDADSSYTVPFPLQNGATWQFAEQPPVTGNILSMSADVTVTAGSFSGCMEMQVIFSDSVVSVSNTTDFARNVGNVKNVLVVADNTITSTVTNSLETYSVN